MSTLKAPRHVSRRKELRQDQVVTFYAKAWQFFDQNRPLVYGGLAVIVALALALVGYGYYQSQQNVEAQQQLGRVVTLYENGNYRQALDGTEDAPGLLSIVDNYGGTTAGNLATFYAADALFRLGDYDQALTYFDQFDKDENVLGASAIAGQGSVHEAKGNFEQAGDLYREAALFFESAFTSPQYLLNAGRAYEEAGNYADAEEVYEMIKEDYPESEVASNIDFFLARARAKQSS